MSLEDIRKRYQPSGGNLAEEVKRLRAENAQQRKDIQELLAEIERLKTGLPPGPVSDETSEIEKQLERAGLHEYFPQGPPTVPRETSNVKGNIEAGRVNPLFATTKGIAIETHAFDEAYEGKR
jgi:hypothetical protein